MKKISKQIYAIYIDEISIVSDGKSTVASCYYNNVKIKATARLHPNDKFDFMTGAALALSRLYFKI